MVEIMIARQTKFTTIANLILGIVWFSLAMVQLVIEDGSVVSGMLYFIVAIAYIIMQIYYRQKGHFRIENGVIVRYEFPLKPKRIKIDEINRAKCVGSYYTLQSSTKKMSIELANIHNDDIPIFEKKLREIVMSVPPYKRD
jgi:hypothetical protein